MQDGFSEDSEILIDDENGDEQEDIAGDATLIDPKDTDENQDSTAQDPKPLRAFRPVNEFLIDDDGQVWDYVCCEMDSNGKTKRKYEKSTLFNHEEDKDRSEKDRSVKSKSKEERPGRKKSDVPKKRKVKVKVKDVRRREKKDARKSD